MLLTFCFCLSDLVCSLQLTSINYRSEDGRNDSTGKSNKFIFTKCTHNDKTFDFDVLARIPSRYCPFCILINPIRFSGNFLVVNFTIRMIVAILFCRQLINQQFRLKKCEGDVSKPIYVICDGNNVESTVILGAQKDDNFLMSTKVNVLGFLSKEHESLCLKQMVKNHVMNTRVKDCKVSYRMF